jgi:hypothetical protein
MNATIKHSETNTESIYRTWLIVPVANYSDGLTDWQVYEDEGKEQGHLLYRRSLEDVKEFIDEKQDDLHEVLVNKAYAASGYQPTSDSMVYGDRITALNKKTDTQLLNIISK